MKINKSGSNKIIFYTLIAFSIIITTLFLWNESIDINSRVNSEKVASYFTALGAFAAGLSLFFLNNQLRTMNVANELISKPDLYPSFTEFEVKDEIGFSLSESNNKPIVRIFRLVINKLTTPYVELFNLGNGSAKDISIKWHYDISKVNSLIDGKYHYEKITTSEQETVDFLEEKGKIPISIPFHYFNCCGSQLNPNILDRIETSQEKPKPILKLSISYQDIQNNRIEKSFNVNVSAYDSSVQLKFIIE